MSIILVHIVQQCLPKDWRCRPTQLVVLGMSLVDGCLAVSRLPNAADIPLSLQPHVLFLVLHLLYPIGFAHLEHL